MMVIPRNRAAWQPSKLSSTFEIKSSPYTPPPPNHITIKTHALAINPVDYMIQQKGNIMYTWLKYPCILGVDIAGEIFEVGKNVTNFQVGDRVIGFARGVDEDVNDASQGAFQEYCVIDQNLASRIPDKVAYEDAVVIPLGAGTAAAGLFQKDQLALQLPSLEPKAAGKTLIVWGGSTSVGCNAIQLGVAAGYEVFATCSPRNFELVKKLGASKVFDYKSTSLVPDIISAFKNKVAAGALVIGHGGGEACMSILDAVEGSKFISMASYPMLQKEPINLVFLRTAWYFASWTVMFKVKGFFKGIKSKFIFGSSIAQNEVGKALFRDFLPTALDEGKFIAAPQSEVFGKGLESIQEACDYHQKGVSAKKVVVVL